MLYKDGSRGDQFDIFIFVMNFQLHEMNPHFSNNVVELLALSSASDSQYEFKIFQVENICKLVNNIYPYGFTKLEM